MKAWLPYQAPSVELLRLRARLAAAEAQRDSYRDTAVRAIAAAKALHRLAMGTDRTTEASTP